jgi:hypothetical protein
MGNKLIFCGGLLAFLLLMAFANNVAHATPCNPTPSSVDYGGYTIVWHTQTPAIYYNTHLYESQTPELTLTAEFDSDRGVWLFYNHVPDSVVVYAHRHWRSHRRHYRRCMGYRANFYYQRYHSHYNYRWYQRQLRSGKVFRKHHHHNPPRYRHYRQRYNSSYTQQHNHNGSYTKQHSPQQKRRHHKRNKRNKRKRHHRR